MNITQTLQEAQSLGYTVGRHLPFVESYMEHCRRTDTPWVYLWPEGENAFVGVTLAVNSYRMSLPAFRQIRDLLQSYSQASPKPDFLEDTFDAEFAASSAVAAAMESRLARKVRLCLEVGDLPLEYAEAIAEEILVILDQPGARIDSTL